MKPSIVIILLDQLRADALGIAGNRYARTPRLDAFAKSATRYETCVTNGPLCRPARMSLMTGLPVHVHGQRSNQGALRPNAFDSHVRRLRDAGYHTAVVGKTHLHEGTGHLDDHGDLLRAWGFRDAIELPDPQAHWLESAHSDWLRASSRDDHDKWKRWRAYAIHHGETRDLSSPDDPPWGLDARDHLDRFCGHTAAKQIRALPRDRSVYLQVSFPGPHPPFDAPRSVLESFAVHDDAMPVPIVDREGPVSPISRRIRQRQQRDLQEPAWRALRRAYFAKVAWVDNCLGDVLDALRETTLDEHAFVIVTSDHGELLGDHGVTGKVLPYEAATRVPLLIRPPGGAPEERVSAAVDHLDLVATLLDIAGLPQGEHGRSLLRPVTRKDIVFEAMGYVAIRTSDATLAWDRKAARPVELYDRALDPDETRNRVHTDRARVDTLVDRLRATGALR